RSSRARAARDFRVPRVRRARIIRRLVVHEPDFTFPFSRQRQESLGQRNGFLHGFHIEDRIARDQLLALSEGPVRDRELPVRNPDTGTPGTGLQSVGGNQHAGLRQIFYELSHRRHFFLRGRHIALTARLVECHDSHASVSCFGVVRDYCCCREAIAARWRSSCSRSSGVNSLPKSSASKTWRISMSESLSNGLGQRLTHSIASSFDLTWMSQKPAISSLVSANGPSITVRFEPENRTRAPLALVCSPSIASSTPAFTSSSLYLPMAASSSLLGSLPASLSALALTITMNRIDRPPYGYSVDSASMCTSNEGGGDRHRRWRATGGAGSGALRAPAGSAPLACGHGAAGSGRLPSGAPCGKRLAGRRPAACAGMGNREWEIDRAGVGRVAAALRAALPAGRSRQGAARFPQPAARLALPAGRLRRPLPRSAATRSGARCPASASRPRSLPAVRPASTLPVADTAAHPDGAAGTRSASSRRTRRRSS